MSNKVLVFEAYAQTLGSLKNNTLFAVDTSIGRVCMVKLGAGLKFFKDACPHLHVPFSQSGVCNAFGELVCKEHGHRYELNSGRECQGHVESLEFIAHEVEDDKLYLVF